MLDFADIASEIRNIDSAKPAVGIAEFLARKLDIPILKKEATFARQAKQAAGDATFLEGESVVSSSVFSIAVSATQTIPPRPWGSRYGLFFGIASGFSIVFKILASPVWLCCFASHFRATHDDLAVFVIWRFSRSNRVVSLASKIKNVRKLRHIPYAIGIEIEPAWTACYRASCSPAATTDRGEVGVRDRYLARWQCVEKLDPANVFSA